MQINTTGHSMETILDVILFIVLPVSLIMNCVYCRNFFLREKKTSEFHENIVRAITEQTEKYTYTQDKIDALGCGLDRSMLALREILEPTKPIKTNNWDSVRQAFKGPARIEVNERN